MRAKQKEQNPILWGGLTIVLFLMTSFIGIIIVFMSILKDTLDINKVNAQDQKYARELAEQVSQAILANPIHSITILVFGLGGYLLVRYILEKKPVKKKDLGLWPDKESVQ